MRGLGLMGGASSNVWRGCISQIRSPKLFPKPMSCLRGVARLLVWCSRQDLTVARADRARRVADGVPMSRLHERPKRSADHRPHDRCPPGAIEAAARCGMRNVIEALAAPMGVVHGASGIWIETEDQATERTGGAVTELGPETM